MKVDPGANVVMCNSMGHQRLIAEAIKYSAKNITKPFKPPNVIQALVKHTVDAINALWK